MPRPTASPAGSPSPWRVALAFTAICILWGTTYLAIRYGLETLPPFLMTSARFFIAGGLLFAWARFRGVPDPALDLLETGDRGLGLPDGRWSGDGRVGRDAHPFGPDRCADLGYAYLDAGT